MIRKTDVKSKVVRIGVILGVLLTAACTEYDERDPLRLSYEQIADMRDFRAAAVRPFG